MGQKEKEPALRHRPGCLPEFFGRLGRAFAPEPPRQPIQIDIQREPKEKVEEVPIYEKFPDAGVKVSGIYVARKDLPPKRRGDGWFTIKNDTQTIIGVIDVSYGGKAPFIWTRNPVRVSADLLDNPAETSSALIAEPEIKEDLINDLIRSLHQSSGQQRPSLPDIISPILTLYCSALEQIPFSDADLGASITMVIIDPDKPEWEVVSLGTSGAAITSNLDKQNNNGWRIIAQVEKFHTPSPIEHKKHPSLGDILEETVHRIKPGRLLLMTDGIVSGREGDEFSMDTKGKSHLQVKQTEGVCLVLELLGQVS